MMEKGAPANNISIMYNATNPKARKVATELRDLVKKHGIKIIDLEDAPDVLVVIGGDGTLLRAFHQTHGEYPLLGVVNGTFGTLMEVEKDRLDCALHRLSTGDYWVEVASVLETIEPVRLIALNEFLIRSGKIGKSSRIGFGVDGSPVNECICDGLLISTPTGSLAYSLATEGPVLDPRVKGIVISMVAPWPPSLQVFFKSLVVPEESTIEVWDPSSEVYVVSDGLNPVKARPPIRLRMASEINAKFVRMSHEPSNFYRRIVKRMSPKPLTGIMNYLETGLSPTK